MRPRFGGGCGSHSPTQARSQRRNTSRRERDLIPFCLVCGAGASKPKLRRETWIWELLAWKWFLWSLGKSEFNDFNRTMKGIYRDGQPSLPHFIPLTRQPCCHCLLQPPSLSETRACYYIAQAGFEIMIYLPQLSKYGNYRHVPPCPASSKVLKLCNKPKQALLITSQCLPITRRLRTEARDSNKVLTAHLLNE